MEKELRVGLHFTEKIEMEAQTTEYGVIKVGNDYLFSVGYTCILYQKLDDSQDLMDCSGKRFC